jgi:hypothetical protein
MSYEYHCNEYYKRQEELETEFGEACIQANDFSDSELVAFLGRDNLEEMAIDIILKR